MAAQRPETPEQSAGKAPAQREPDVKRQPTISPAQFRDRQWQALEALAASLGEPGAADASRPLTARIHADDRLSNLEYLICPDGIDLGLAESTGSYEGRARQFLAALQSRGLLTRGQDNRRLDLGLLELRHVLRSLMGTHCIFEQRWGDDEMLSTCFVVHFNIYDSVVAVVSVYQPLLEDPAMTALPAPDQVERIGAQLRTLEQAHGAGVGIEPKYAPNWEGGYYERVYQLKQAQASQNMVLLLNGDGKDRHAYMVACRLTVSRTSPGQVYKTAWGAEEETEDEARARADVFLRGLRGEQGLSGRYVSVEAPDLASERMLAPRDLRERLRVASWRSSVFDATMAYYHADRIQRYFRELGLDALDEYTQLNPLRISLGHAAEPTQYLPDRGVNFRLLDPQGVYRCTDARSAQVVYHECVHAVTDALARLRRQAGADPCGPRLRQSIQAAAMDEGLADYFACSLAERDGARAALIGPLELDRSAGKGRLRLKHDGVRQLSQPTGEPFADYDLTLALAPEGGEAQGRTPDDKLVSADGKSVNEELYYSWGEQWARYLWYLRRSVFNDPLEADRVIAHSMLFLTRWAGLDQGVQALALADTLLADGRHASAILSAAKLPEQWRTLPRGRAASREAAA